VEVCRYDQLLRVARFSFVKASTKNRVKGRAKEVSGRAKSKLGKATRNPRLRDRGDEETIAGKLQRKLGEVAKVFGG